MSLQEEIEEIMQDGVVAFLPAEQIVMMKTDTSERVINKVLDAAIEAIETLSNDSGVGPATDMVKIMAHHEAIEAINKLRSEK